MPLITDEVAGQLKEEFARLVHPVRLAVFSQALADPESEQVKRLVEELANVDSRITAVERIRSVEIVNTVRVVELKARAIGGVERSRVEIN